MPTLQVYLPEQTYSALMGVAEGRALTGSRLIRELVEQSLGGNPSWIGAKKEKEDTQKLEKEEFCPEHGLNLVFQGTDVVCAACKKPYLA